VALSLGRRFERGTLLTIEIQPPGNRFLDPLLARVVHVAAQPDGSWLVGCAFSREISEEDLQRLL